MTINDTVRPAMMIIPTIASMTMLLLIMVLPMSMMPSGSTGYAALSLSSFLCVFGHMGRGDAMGG
ncbi:hypothetical protein [Streptosporangium sp. NPDC087985]|uniref:hypothetical protein n=1 Tax=Streptosporangium sp. NPDC087985 TaxID=3366196 RepID=UPI0038181A04